MVTLFFCPHIKKKYKKKCSVGERLEHDLSYTSFDLSLYWYMRTTKQVHISTIKAGDTVHHKGSDRTVCKNNIKQCSLFGQSIFGDSYHAGHKTVTKVIFAVPTSEGVVYR